jgi:hypothetical protein
VSINIIVAIAGVCLIDLCYMFVVRCVNESEHRRESSGHWEQIEFIE